VCQAPGAMGRGVERVFGIGSGVEQLAGRLEEKHAIFAASAGVFALTKRA